MAREFTENPSLLKELAEDEKILWKGAPEAFPLMTEETKKSLTQRWLICIVLAVALAATYIVMLGKAESGINAWVLILVLVAVAYYACIPMLDRSNIYKKCKYYITDRRVILDYGERDIYSLPLAGLRSEIIPAEAGCIHVNLGACVGIAGAKRRVASFVPKKDDNDNINGFVIYNIADEKAVRDIFAN